MPPSEIDAAGAADGIFDQLSGHDVTDGEIVEASALGEVRSMKVDLARG